MRKRTCFNLAGNVPVEIQKLQMWPMAGTMHGMIHFSNLLGVKFKSHDLTDDLLISFTLSLTDEGSNEFSGGTWRGMISKLLAVTQ